MAASKSKLLNPKSLFSFSVYRQRRLCQAAQNTKLKKKQIIQTPSLPPEDIHNDWIGPPDKVSNIRKMKFYIPENETPTERSFREQREATQEWHHQFWTEHNKRFFKLKDEFVKSRLAEKSKHGDTAQTLTPEEMSEFYQKFLDDNYFLHKKYNVEWYRKNISMLWPALKVSFIRLFLNRKRQRDNT